MDDNDYLRVARRQAKKNGYDPSKLTLATDGVHKLVYESPEGKMTPFGKKGFGDYIIYSDLERNGWVEDGYASKKRRTYHASHSKLKGKWHEDPFSPNMLSLNINW